MGIRSLLTVLCASTLIGFIASEFQNPYPPTAALFGPRNKFICNAIVLGRGKILTSAECLHLKQNDSTYSLGKPEQFHVALETHTIERFQSGKAFTGKAARWKYLGKLSQKMGLKYDNKYGNDVLSDKLKPEEIRYLKKALRSGGVESKQTRSNYVPVLSYTIHPEFGKKFINDVAVLEIGERFPADNSSIADVYPYDLETGFDRVVQVYGFGVLSHGGSETNRSLYLKIRKVEMQLLPPGRCLEFLKNLFKPDQHMCLMPKGSDQLCFGFTGAPIVLGGKLIGFVEFGHNSCSMDTPVVGVRLDKHRHFLGLESNSIWNNFLKFLKIIMGGV